MHAASYSDLYKEKNSEENTLVALGVAGRGRRCAGLCRRAHLRESLMVPPYGSSESKPRARARATAWTRLCTPSFSKIWVT